MDFHYLGSAAAIPRCIESTTRHCFAFLPPCFPTGTVYRSRPLSPFASEKNARSGKHLCLKLSIQPILRKVAVSNPKTEPVCKKLPVGFVKSIMFLILR